jgi:hypothetical protein
VTENFLRRAENLLAAGTLTPYQAHKLRKVLNQRKAGGAM